ncbi:MAG: hypothetical protein PWQ23_609, partial [Thermoanaerobacter sp.]|nr:hypothetical protein [Thermoanaerobacter sp.]
MILFFIVISFIFK